MKGSLLQQVAFGGTLSSLPYPPMRTGLESLAVDFAGTKPFQVGKALPTSYSQIVSLGRHSNFNLPQPKVIRNSSRLGLDNGQLPKKKVYVLGSSGLEQRAR